MNLLNNVTESRVRILLREWGRMHRVVFSSHDDNGSTLPATHLNKIMRSV